MNHRSSFPGVSVETAMEEAMGLLWEVQSTALPLGAKAKLNVALRLLEQAVAARLEERKQATPPAAVHQKQLPLPLEQE